MQVFCVQFLLTIMFLPTTSSEQKTVGKIIKFGTNIDLSDPKR